MSERQHTSIMALLWAILASLQPSGDWFETVGWALFAFYGISSGIHSYLDRKEKR